VTSNPIKVLCATAITIFKVICQVPRHGLLLKKKRNPEAVECFDVETLEAWRRFNSLVFEEGKLSKKVKELVAVACTYITSCPFSMMTCEEGSG